MSDEDSRTRVPPNGAPASRADALRHSRGAGGGLAVAERPRPDNGAAISALPPKSWGEIARLVWAEAHGTAGLIEVATLETDPQRWERVLLDGWRKTETSLSSVRRLPRPIRRQVVRDFEADFKELAAAYERLTGLDAERLTR